MLGMKIFGTAFIALMLCVMFAPDNKDSTAYMPMAVTALISFVTMIIGLLVAIWP